MKKLSPLLLGVAIGSLIGILVAQRFLRTASLGATDATAAARKIETILNNAAKNYVDEVDADKLAESAIRAMLSELDPHSVYIPVSLREREREDIFGSFEGIGVQFEIINDTVVVVAPIIGGPSEKLGVRAGDKIVRIEEESAVGMADTAIVRRLKGEKGTQVTIGVKRGTMPEILEFTITRDQIPIYSVSAAFLIPNTSIGYIAVNQFRATMFSEFVQAARKLKDEGMNSMILDLRGNPGGLLAQAFEMADAFIPAGKQIVYTKGRKPGSNDVYISTGGGEFEEIPLIVLIDEGSASASEIIAGAVQDLDRGIVVGETSFGKGLVQASFELDDGSSYRLTVSRYYTPSGRSIQRDYKDAKRYRQLVGRAEADEGDNFEHKERASDSSLPAYKTASGRVVYGGGGIVPDYVVKRDTATALAAHLSAKVLREYCDRLVSDRGEQIRQRFQGNFARFSEQFSLNAADIAALRALAEKRGVAWDETEWKTDERLLRALIQSQISLRLWGRMEEKITQMKVDKQLMKAVELFPEVRKLAKLH
jgi:carboxyl-terminal processing protease